MGGHLWVMYQPWVGILQVPEEPEMLKVDQGQGTPGQAPPNDRRAGDSGGDHRQLRTN